MIYRCDATMTASFSGTPQAKFQFMIDMIHLAMVTDSARVISLLMSGMHHGKEPKKLDAAQFHRGDEELWGSTGLPACDLDFPQAGR